MFLQRKNEKTKLWYFHLNVKVNSWLCKVLGILNKVKIKTIKTCNLDYKIYIRHII